MKTNKMETTKRAYEKPRLRTIELSADEILAVGCKSDVAAGSTPGSPPNCLGNPCAGIGS